MASRVCTSVVILTCFSGLVALGSGCCPPVPEPDASGCEILRWHEQCLARITPFENSDHVDRLVLDSIPAELEYVMNHRETFLLEKKHPLADVEPGTILGAADGLSGCWGRIQLGELQDPSASFLVAGAVVIDPTTNRYSCQQLNGLDGMPCLEDRRPYVVALEQRILAIEADRLVLQMPRFDDDVATIAGLEPDGTLTFHSLARYTWELAAGQEYSKRFTIDGDHMIATSNGVGTATHLWVRFPCP